MLSGPPPATGNLRWRDRPVSRMRILDSRTPSLAAGQGGGDSIYSMGGGGLCCVGIGSCGSCVGSAMDLHVSCVASVFVWVPPPGARTG